MVKGCTFPDFSGSAPAQLHSHYNSRILIPSKAYPLNSTFLKYVSIASSPSSSKLCSGILHVLSLSPQIMKQSSSSHSDDNMSGGSFSAGALNHWAHALVGVVMTPEGKVYTVFLQNPRNIEN